jgi:eukaryotic-like serine/threonine-protein kinase
MPAQDGVNNAAVGREDATLESTTLPVMPGESEGAVLGRYRLVQMIGEGGMGEVWLAEQKEPVRRRVAIKLIKAGMNTREVIARFESERQALALMDHPAIAKVLDAGSTPQGMPYFAMEYVAGVRITTYCDNHRLSMRERLELFVRVCEGVQHAHQKAIIHRDLKPSNILVTEVDGHPAPKIIDFGVAKALTQRLSGESVYTRVGALIGTPEYMSPEQALSSGEDIDTRSDIYSLGIIFYELLAGKPPLELRGSALDEFLRKIREDDAPKPSTRIRTQDLATSTEVARNRQTEPPMLVRQILGELDAIALKALEKDRSRRYASATDFAADIGRYLRNEPVLAVAPSLAYRARKFVSRYRAGLAIASAFALVLIVATVVSIRQSIRARHEAAVAEAVNDFLQNDLLGQASANNQSGPKAKPDPNITVRTVLDRAAQRIDGKFANQPEVEVALRTTMGAAYNDLGVYPEARTQLERALETGRRTLGPDDPRTLVALSDLGWVAYRQGKDAEAETLESQALEAQRRVLGPQHPDTLQSMRRLGVAYLGEGKYAQAEAVDAQTLETDKRVLGPEHRDTLRSMYDLALVYSDEGKYAQAETLGAQVLEAFRRVLGPEHPDTLMSMNGLASYYRGDRKYAQAEALDAQTLEIRKRVLGPEHPDTLGSMSSLAIDYEYEDKYAQAEALNAQTLEARKRTMGPEHPDTLWSMNNLATDYENEGKYAQAEALDSQTLEARKRVLGPEHPDTLWSMNNLATDSRNEGKYAQAEALDSQTLEARKRVLGPEHPDTLASMNNLAADSRDEGKYAQAEALDSQTLEARKRVLGPEHPDTLGSMNNLAADDREDGKYAQAEALDAQTLEIRKRVLGPEHPDTLESMETLASDSMEEGKYAQAEALYAQTLEIRKRVLGPESPGIAGLKYNMGCLEARQGNKDKAIALLSDAVDHGLPPGDDLHMATDTDLTSLHNDPRFTALVAHARQMVASASAAAPASH